MILTICIFSFASLVSPVPTTEQCFRTDSAGLTDATARCEAINHDPLSTCEVQRVGATRYYIRIRSLETKAPVAPARKLSVQA